MTSQGLRSARVALCIGALIAVGSVLGGCIPEQRPPVILLTWGGFSSPARLGQIGKVGHRYTYRCPVAPADPAEIGGAWGTARYTADSSICTAARHDGRITEAGGLVTYEIGAAFDAFVGSTQNGVTTGDFGPSPGSFTFVTR